MSQEVGNVEQRCVRQMPFPAAQCCSILYRGSFTAYPHLGLMLVQWLVPVPVETLLEI
jgi:hypothetical protein